MDGPQLRERLWAGENDAAEGGGGEHEEEREVELFGFGLPPLAEALVEGLLFGGEVFGWFRGCGASARESAGLGRDCGGPCE